MDTPNEPLSQPALINAAIAAGQFEALDPQTARMLGEAVQSDFLEWGDRLAAAAAMADETAMAGARHSLKGLCGNFGAAALLALAEEALDSAEARAAMLACRDATVTAILAAAGEVSG